MPFGISLEPSTVQKYSSIQSFTPLRVAIATTGTFDGLHAGHQMILNKMRRLAENQGGETVLITFDPHPRQLIHPEFKLELLTTVEERAELLEAAGLDHLIIHPFTRDFSRLDSLEFVRKHLVGHVGVKHLVIGYDHRFGRNREGSFDHLKEFGPVYGFQVAEIPALEVDEVNISSTKIREAVASGDMETAAQGLTRPYFVSGRVGSGQGIGRGMGYPTANVLDIHPQKLMPAKGVYAVKVDLGDQKGIEAVANYGVRPSFGGVDPVLEVHLLQRDGNFYESDIRVHFLRKLRDEIRFASKEDLKAQIAQDVVQAEALFQKA